MRNSELLKWARANRLYLSDFVKLRAKLANNKKLEREANRYGTELRWADAEKHDSMLTVPKLSKKGNIVGYECFFTKNMLPKQFREFWEMKNENEIC